MREHLLTYIDKAKSPNVRGLRILVEYFYALDIFRPVLASNRPIVSVFGSARLHPQHKDYQEAKKLGKLLYENGYAVVTGASKGVMQAANEGVVEGIVAELSHKKQYRDQGREQIMSTAVFKKRLSQYSVGLKISLPFEEEHNPYVGVLATFHYFMVRKFFFGTLSSAFIACEGGWGTRDELFEMLTLVQTGKSPLMPVIFISSHPQHLLNDVRFSIKRKMISPEDQYLLDVVADYRDAVAIIKRFYSVVQKVSYDKMKKVEIFLTQGLSLAKRRKVVHFLNKKYPEAFKTISFGKKKIELSGFSYRSYGILRKLIDEISL